MRSETPVEPRQPIREVLDLAMLYNEELFRSSSYPVQQWLAEGMDLHLDIIPAMKQVIDRRHKGRNVPKITTFSYFTNALREWHEKRMAEERAKKPTGQPDDADAIHRKAKMAARTVRKFGIKDGEAMRFLAAYEAKHGVVLL